MTLLVTIPGPPVPWERNAGSGKRRFTSPRTRAYQAHVRRCGAFAMLAARLAAWNGPVRVSRRFYLPDARRRDEDNLIKSINDGLNGVVWADDSWIKSASVDVLIDRERPRVELEIEFLDELNGWVSPALSASRKVSSPSSRPRKKRIAPLALARGPLSARR